jgi:hypothetical protein
MNRLRFVAFAQRALRCASVKDDRSPPSFFGLEATDIITQAQSHETEPHHPLVHARFQHPAGRRCHKRSVMTHAQTQRPRTIVGRYAHQDLNPRNGWDDSWEKKYPAHTADPKGDPDDDGIDNFTEMLDGTDPTRANKPGEIFVSAEEKAAQEQQRIAIQNAAQQAWDAQVAAVAPVLRPLIAPGKMEPDYKLNAVENDTNALKADAAVSRLTQAGQQRALDDLARRYGVEKEIREESGKKLKLTGDSLGPVFIQGHDTLSAASISADELWPTVWWWPYSESNTGLGLTGSGQTLGMWEVDGGVRRTHIEMGTSRVFQKDSAALDTTHHATNVAGTMAAAGTGSLFGSFYESRGVAYQASVFAYETNTSFQTERESAAAGNVTDPPVRLSNHSWGQIAGWRVEDIDPTAGVNNQWVWYGPTLASFQEDHKFGFYMPDNPSGSDGGTQIDHFHHTQATRHLMVYSCGNDRAQGPGSSPGTYYYRTGAISWTAVSAASFPRDWDDGDAGFYDTIVSPGTAKNVLTVGSCDDVHHISGGFLTIGFGPGAVVNPSSFSGMGPTDDGRIKPDLVAVGSPGLTLRQPLGLMNAGSPVITAPNSAADSNYTLGLTGTSFSAPAVTGALGLVLERRAQLYPSLPASQAWRGSTLKAIAINTCDDVGDEGPDYRTGHGVMNARKAVLAVNADHANGRGSLIKEFILSVDQTESWVVRSNGTEPLTVTVPWSDPPGPALTTISAPDPQNAMLVNNIDVRVEYIGADALSSPPAPTTAVTYLPWVLNPDLTTKSSTTRSLPATRAVDTRNNVEKISIAYPAAGRYRIIVTHSGGLSGNPAPSAQVVSAVLGGVTPELPRITSLAQSPTANQHLMSFTADPGAYFTIQSSTDMINWTDVGSVLAEAAANAVIVANTNGEERRFWRIRRGQ